MGNTLSTKYGYEEAQLNDKHIYSKIDKSFVDIDDCTPVYKSCNIDDDDWRYKSNGKRISVLTELFYNVCNQCEPNTPFLGTRTYITKKDYLFDKSESKEVSTQEEEKCMSVNDSNTNSMLDGYERNANNTIKRGDYTWNTLQEVRETFENFGRGQKELGVNKGDNVGIFSINNAEVYITEFACLTQGYVVVPQYATLGLDAVEYITNYSQQNVIISSKENLPQQKDLCEKVHNTIRIIIQIDPLFDNRFNNLGHRVEISDIKYFEKYNIELLGYSKVLEMGQKKSDVIPLYTPIDNDIAYIIYTSGTTGVPKGVVLTHKNFISVVQGLDLVCPRFSKSEVYFSFLPVAHVLETAGQMYSLTFCSRIAFFSGDIRNLIEDLKLIKPSLFPGVPRLFIRFYQNVWKEIDKLPMWKRYLVYTAYDIQVKLQRSGKNLNTYIDKYIMYKTREKLGLTNIRFILTGSSPCPSHILEFMRIILNSDFVEGYGQTECSAGGCVDLIYNKVPGSCGPPLYPCCARLRTVSELGYTIHDKYPRGELLLHGPNIFQGYYKNEKATNEIQFNDANGKVWLCTGDIARLNPNGTFSIIDRKKSLIKLAQGEYISLESIEETYSLLNQLSQVWCYGNSYKSNLVGIIVLDCTYVYDLAIEKGWVDKHQLPTIIQGNLSDECIQLYKKQIHDHYGEYYNNIKEQFKPIEEKLPGFKKIRKVYIDSDIDNFGLVFTESKNLLTPTMKKKRAEQLRKYSDQLQKLYEELGEAIQLHEK